MPKLEVGQIRGATITCKVVGVLPPSEGVAEALRSHSHGSQRASEVSSPLILRLVRKLVTCTSTNSSPPPTLLRGQMAVKHQKLVLLVASVGVRRRAPRAP